MGQIPSARLRILQLPRPPGARLRASPHAPSQKPPSTLASNTDGKVDETADSHHTGNLNQNSLNRSLCFKRVSYVLPSLSQRPCCLGLFCPPLKMTKFLWMAPSNWTGQNLHRSEQATCTSQNWDCLCSLSMLLGDLSLSYGHQWTYYVSNTH